MDKEITIYRSKNGCIVIKGDIPLVASNAGHMWTFENTRSAIPTLRMLLKLWDGYEPTPEEKSLFNLWA